MPPRQSSGPVKRPRLTLQPVSVIGSETWLERGHVKTLFHLLDQILREADKRLCYIGVCLYCLQHLLVPLKRKGPGHTHTHQVGVVSHARASKNIQVSV